MQKIDNNHFVVYTCSQSNINLLCFVNTINTNIISNTDIPEVQPIKQFSRNTSNAGYVAVLGFSQPKDSHNLHKFFKVVGLPCGWYACLRCVFQYTPYYVLLTINTSPTLSY